MTEDEEQVDKLLELKDRSRASVTSSTTTRAGCENTTTRGW